MFHLFHRTYLILIWFFPDLPPEVDGQNYDIKHSQNAMNKHQCMYKIMNKNKRIEKTDVNPRLSIIEDLLLVQQKQISGLFE